MRQLTGSKRVKSEVMKVKHLLPDNWKCFTIHLPLLLWAVYINYIYCVTSNNWSVSCEENLLFNYWRFLDTIQIWSIDLPSTHGSRGFTAQTQNQAHYQIVWIPVSIMFLFQLFVVLGMTCWLFQLFVVLGMSCANYFNCYFSLN